MEKCGGRGCRIVYSGKRTCAAVVEFDFDRLRPVGGGHRHDPGSCREVSVVRMPPQGRRQLCHRRRDLRIIVQDEESDDPRRKTNSNSCARSTRRRSATCSRSSRRSGAATATPSSTCTALSRPAADRRLRQDRDLQGEGQGAARRSRLHAEAARLSRLCRERAAARHHGHARPRRTEHAGFGAFWGEVQSNVHKALGALGVVTDGSIRDIPMIAPGFQMLAGHRSCRRTPMCTWSITAST